MQTSDRLRIALPLAGLSGLAFGGAIIGAGSAWWQLTDPERVITVLLCAVTGVSFGLSISIAVDRRITAMPWLRIIVISVFLLLSCAVAVIRRQIGLDNL